MPDIETGNRLDLLKTELDSLAGGAADTKLTQSIEEMLTALHYADETLLKASFQSLLSALADAARDVIVKELNRVKATRDGIRKAWSEHVDGSACEDFDELRNVLESIVDDRIASMTRLRDKLVRPLGEWECRVENADGLERGIRDLRQFRHDLLKNWPSSDACPSPIDKAAIAEARAAIASGAKGLTKDQLKWAT